LVKKNFLAKGQKKMIGYFMRANSSELNEIISILEFIFLHIKPIASIDFLQKIKESKGDLSNKDGFLTTSTFGVPLEYFFEIDYFNKILFKGEFDLKKIKVHFELKVKHNINTFSLMDLHPFLL